MVAMLCSKIQQGPGPDFRKVGKSLLFSKVSYEGSTLIRSNMVTCYIQINEIQENIDKI